MYEINYSKPAERYFKKIKDKQLLATFKTAIDNLKSPGTVLKQPFRGKKMVEFTCWCGFTAIVLLII